MPRISLENLMIVLSSDVLKNNTCIEMHFGIDSDPEYNSCWLGKMSDKENPGTELYWYGLVPDGSQASDYDNLENMLNAKVFHGKSLRDVIEQITWYSLDACDVEVMLPLYLKSYQKRIL